MHYLRVARHFFVYANHFFFYVAVPFSSDGSGSIDREEFLQIPQIATNPLASRMIAIFDEEYVSSTLYFLNSPPPSVDYRPYPSLLPWIGGTSLMPS